MDKYVKMAELDTHISSHLLRHTDASHSCPCLHFHITFLWEPRDTCVGFNLFFFDHWRANSGFKVARSLIPSTTLAPEQADVDGFNTYIKQYKQLLEVERKAVEVL